MDCIFDQENPLNECLEEAEAPVFNGDDLNWLYDVDDDENGDDGRLDDDTTEIDTQLESKH